MKLNVEHIGSTRRTGTNPLLRPIISVMGRYATIRVRYRIIRVRIRIVRSQPWVYRFPLTVGEITRRFMEFADNALFTPLRAAPDWELLNAYDRTKRCCQLLLEQGQRIPTWETLRAVIGKGSSNDINRAKNDFIREHGAQVRALGGIVKGVPEEITPQITALWTAAIAQAKREYDIQTAEWSAELQAAQQRVDDALLARDAARDQAAAVAAMHAGLQEAHATLQAALATEVAAKNQAEKMASDARSDLIAQRESLQAELSRARSEVDLAVKRLEGVETHALRRVDEIKTEAEARIADLTTKLNRISSERSVESARYSTQLRELRGHLEVEERNKALHDAELAGLRERLTRAEGQVDALSADNAKLLALVKVDRRPGPGSRFPRRPRRSL